MPSKEWGEIIYPFSNFNDPFLHKISHTEPAMVEVIWMEQRK